MAVDVIIDPSSGQIYWNDQAGAGTQTIAISGNATNAINVVGYSNFFSAGGGGLGTQILATFTDSPTSTFTPGTNAYDLGSSSLRWNFYGTGGNFTGAISTSSTTDSTSSTTGALTVSGGAGIAKTSYFGQDVKILGSTASTNQTTGALVVTGGVGISGTLNVGTSIPFYPSGNIASFGQSIAGTAHVKICNSNTGGTTNKAELVVITPGAFMSIGVYGDNYYSPAAGFIPNSAYIYCDTGIVFESLYYNQKFVVADLIMEITGSGVSLYPTTESTNTSTGALTVNGGAGIALTSYFGQSVVIQGTTASGSTTTGALVVSGGVGIGGSLNVFGTIDVANNIEVLSQKEVRFFNSANTFYTGLKAGSSSANVTFTLPVADGSANQVLYTNGSAGLAWTTIASVSAITTLNSLTASTQTFATGTSGSDFNISSGTSTHTFNIPYAGSGATGLITTQAQTLAGSKTFSGQTIISDTTVSSSTATGALLVYGGLGVTGQINAASLQTTGNAIISGNLTFNGVGVFGNATSDTINSLARYISDILPSTDNSYDLGNNSLGWRNFRVSGVGTIASLAVTSTTASTSSTTGALIVSGGAGIAKTSYFGQSVVVQGSTASTNPTNGALVVTGGVGIGGSLNVGNSSVADVIIYNTDYTSSANLNLRTGTGASLKGAVIGFNSTELRIQNTFRTITNYADVFQFYATNLDDYQLIISSAGATFYNTTASTSSTTGALRLQGGAGIAKTSYFGQSVVIQGTTASGSTTTGALVVSGGVGIGGSLNVFGTIDVANNIEVLSQKEVRFFNSANTFYTGLKAGSSSANVTFTLPIADGSANQVLYTNGSAGLAWTTVAGGGVSGIISLNGLTASTQTFATGTSGTDFNISSSTSTHTFNIPYAGSGATGLVTTQAQTLAGSKTFSSQTIISDTTVSSSTATGALLVYGGLGVTGQINAASLQTTGNAIISGNLTFNGVGVFGNATSDTINSLARYISDILPSTDNSYDLGNNSLGWRNFRVSGVGTIASLAVTSVTAGVWGGTAISAVNGGTGQVSYTVGDLLYASSTTALSKLAAGTAGSVLKSNGTGTAPSWQVESTGGGGGTVAAPSAAGLVAYYAGTGASVTSNPIVKIETASSTVEINSQNSKSALILNAANGSVSNLAEFKNSLGDVFWAFGSGASTLRGYGASLWMDSASGIIIDSPAALTFYNTAQTFYTALTGATNASSDLTFILPTAAGTAGSVLTTAGASGELYWSAPGAAGGAGTVASGTANQVAVYAATGASVSGAANFTYNTTSVTIKNTTASNNNSSGALLVHGGIGASGQISGAGASFTSTVFLNGIRIGQGGNNITFTDSAGTTIGDFNTSNGWFRSAQTTNSTSLTTGALVVSGGAGIAKTMFVGDNINIFKSGSVGALRLWNSANTFYTGLQAGNPAANTTYTLPIAFPGSGTSVLSSDTSGTMNWVASGGGSGTVTTLTAGNGITFSTGTTITTTGTIRRRTSYNLVFMSGYTPTASGVDTVVLRVPDSAADAGAVIYNCREVIIRVETPSAGTSTINLQKYAGAGTSAFSTTSVGSTTNILSAALSITGATVHESSSSTFAAGHGTVAGGDKLRVNFTALNATHVAFNISLLLEEQ